MSEVSGTRVDAPIPRPLPPTEFRGGQALSTYP